MTPMTRATNRSIPNELALRALAALLVASAAPACDTSDGGGGPALDTWAADTTSGGETSGDVGADVGADAPSDVAVRAETSLPPADAQVDGAAPADAGLDVAMTDTAPAPDAEATPDAAPEVDTSEPPSLCEAPGTVPCEDMLVLDLSLQGKGKVSPGATKTVLDGDDFVSAVDATAGGYSVASNNPWVYARFTSAGLEKLAIDDQEALLSDEWDIAFRRYMIRLNSGVSGPGCVVAAPAHGLVYEMIDALPAAKLAEEHFYTPECLVIEDGSGLPGSPDFLLAGYWSYLTGCMAMTGLPYVLVTPQGALKLKVQAYYLTGQETCDATGTPGTASANLALRWQWLP